MAVPYYIWRNDGGGLPSSWRRIENVWRNDGAGNWNKIERIWRFDEASQSWKWVYWAPIHVYITSSDYDYNDGKLRAAVLAACGGTFPTGRTLIIHVTDNVQLTRSSASTRNQDYVISLWSYTVGTGNRIILRLHPGSAVVGYGGKGGYNVAAGSYVQAQAGWDAIYVSSDVAEMWFDNQGIIGGGGGGGANYSRQEGGSGNYYSPGGGGAPFGAPGNPFQVDWWATANPGTWSAGGTANPAQNGGRGGTGGVWGQPGGNSEAGRSTSFGGASGYSISSKIDLNWFNVGDIRGAQRRV